MTDTVAVEQVDREAALLAIPASVIFAENEDHLADLRERAAKIFARHRIEATRTFDDRPQIKGDPIAKIASYNDCHEDAVAMGYPSLTEALEHLSELREATRTARPEAGEELVDLLRRTRATLSVTAGTLLLYDGHVTSPADAKGWSDGDGYVAYLNAKSAVREIDAAISHQEPR